MKKYLIIISIVLLAVACNKSDKKTQLDKLKTQRDKITEQITALQLEIAKDKGDTNDLKIPIVGVAEVKIQEFNHFIEVQGKIDGEDNVAVAPRMAGTVTKVFVKEGDVVKVGQILAQIDDAVLRQSIDEVQTQLSFTTTLYNKQKSLWDKKMYTRGFWKNLKKYNLSKKIFDKILKENKGKVIVIVAHGNVIKGIFGKKFGLNFKIAAVIVKRGKGFEKSQIIP